MNVLFTSVGRRVELIQLFRNACNELNLNCRLIGTDIDPLAPAIPYLDIHYIVPPYYSENFILALSDICNSYKDLYVFPLIDPDVLVLSRYKGKLVEEGGANIVVIDQSYAETTADKALTHQFLESINIPVPQIYSNPKDVNSSHFPLFIKPRTGSAAKDTFKVRSFEELQFYYDKIHNPIIEEFLPGPEITNDVTCDFKGSVLGVVSRERIEVRWGEVAKGKTIHNSGIIEHCIEIAKSIEATGPLTMQCIMKNGTPHFTEVNARFGGGAPLGIAAGMNSPKWLLAKAAGIPIEIPPVGSYIDNLYLTRHDTSRFLSQQDYDEYASNTVRS